MGSTDCYSKEKVCMCKEHEIWNGKARILVLAFPPTSPVPSGQTH